MFGRYRQNIILIVSEMIIYAAVLIWLLWYFLPQALA
jgi:hypothetical protein